MSEHSKQREREAMEAKAKRDDNVSMLQAKKDIPDAPTEIGDQETEITEQIIVSTAGSPAVIPNEHGEAEEFTDLVVLCRRLKVKTLLFTGTTSGQGVTSIAAQFASALAQDHDVNILLVDANMRRPALHKRFDIKKSSSVAEIVARHKNLRISVPVIRNRLRVLPAGETKMSPQAVYRSKAFDELLRSARKSFNLTILDCPPVNQAAETRLLASKVDVCVLVVEADKTKLHAAAEARDRIENAGGHLIGAVMNRVRQHVPAWIYNRL